MNIAKIDRIEIIQPNVELAFWCERMLKRAKLEKPKNIRNLKVDGRALQVNFPATSVEPFQIYVERIEDSKENVPQYRFLVKMGHTTSRSTKFYLSEGGSIRYSHQDVELAAWAIRTMKKHHMKELKGADILNVHEQYGQLSFLPAEDAELILERVENKNGERQFKFVFVRYTTITFKQSSCLFKLKA